MFCRLIDQGRQPQDREYYETSDLMSEPPTPSNAQAKRRGLALPPRGQALARLQDLERETEPEAVTIGEAAPEDRDPERPAEVINAVNTASSNAVIHEGSNALSVGDGREREAAAPAPLAAAPTVPLQEPAQILPAAAAPGSRQHLPVRAIREPTTRITVDMPDSLHRKISLLSAETRRSIKDLVIEALSATYFGASEDGR